MPAIRIAVVFAALASTTLHAVALANGGSFFRFDRKYYVPGEVVTARTTFSTDVERSGTVDDGPYHAFLLSSDRWIQPPRIPGDAVPVGQIEITGMGGSVPVARISFTVPRLDPGPYTLALCNLPCRHATLGDLAGGSFSISATKEDALRRELSDQFKGRLAEVRRRLGGRIAETEDTLRVLTARSDVKALTDKVAALERRLSREEAEEPPAPAPPTVPWILAAMFAALAAALWIRRGRTTERSARPGRPANDPSIPMFSDALGPDEEAEDGSGATKRSDRELETADV
jgi:hypothetical protein